MSFKLYCKISRNVPDRTEMSSAVIEPIGQIVIFQDIVIKLTTSGFVYEHNNNIIAIILRYLFPKIGQLYLETFKDS